MSIECKSHECNHSEENHCCNHGQENIKPKIKRIIISFIFFVFAIILENYKNEFIRVPIFNMLGFETILLIIYIISYLLVGFDVIKTAIMNIFKGKLFDENFLMTLATIAAFVINEYPEAVMVMWLYQVGETLQHYAVGKSRKSIAKLMDIRPDYANVERSGNLIEISAKDVAIGEIIVVKPGEKIPLDGKIIEGESLLDTLALTGESLPKKVRKEEEVFSGCINKTGLLKIEVTKTYNNSTVSKILELVEKASDKKAKTENFISSFAKYYTPVVVIIAVFLAFVPPLLFGGANLNEYIQRACTFLVISCPCALVISIPLGFFAGIGGASKQGILIKGSNYLEALAKAKIVVLDKTGTLTKGNFKVTKINSINIREENLLEIASLAESYSEHPIANSIKEAYRQKNNINTDLSRISDLKEISGHGICAKIDGKNVYVGNEKLLNKMKINYTKAENEVGTIIYVAINDIFAGYLVIADEIKEESKNTILDLKKKNSIKKIIMLTGDNKQIAEQVASKLEISEVHAELLPDDKVEQVEKIVKEKNKDETVIFVGDGINDAPVLARADIGIAMGGLGADAAIEAADVVIMDDNIYKINLSITLSKRTLRIIKQNIVFAIAVKILVLLLGAFGMTNMWQAVFADVGVAFLAIINSMRALKINK
ncbi:MAG: cadmium-translocating P-type ATPase [Clostridia bacterium]|nr:cadmium-translocating P-type ATPase [Clostridia bacterium]